MLLKKIQISEIFINKDWMQGINKGSQEYKRLVESIKINGVRVPIKVARNDSANQRFELVDGQHRVEAAKDLGLSKILAIVLDRSAREEVAADLENLKFNY